MMYIASSRKMQAAVDMSHAFAGDQTMQAILSRMPGDVIKECPARIIAQVIDAIDKSYKAGQASTGAEVIDDDAIWIEPLQRLIGFEDLPPAPPAEHEEG